MWRRHWLRAVVGVSTVLAALVVGGSGVGSEARVVAPPGDLADPATKDIAMQLVSSAENSTLDWRAQYGYLEDIDDGRGYTGGLIGFTSGTGDLLVLVRNYTRAVPGNALARFIPALRRVEGTASHTGLGAPFQRAWTVAAGDAAFRRAQDRLRDAMYFTPAVSRAKADGLGALGQFVYYDAMVVHGPGDDPDSAGGIRLAALEQARTPAQGGDERQYLEAYLAARIVVMKRESAHEDVSRITGAQRVFLRQGNLDLHTPLAWTVYGDRYRIA